MSAAGKLEQELEPPSEEEVRLVGDQLLTDPGGYFVKSKYANRRHNETLTRPLAASAPPASQGVKP
jgi:hypothetical protein